MAQTADKDIEKQLTQTEDQGWTTIIKPKDKLLSVDFAELWHYRDLTALFVKRFHLRIA